MNAITMSHVSRSFPGFALKDISLTLPEGMILGLVGENGAGKSTTIRLITGILAPDQGEVSVLGCDSRDAGFYQIKEDLGVVLDEPPFPQVLTLEESERVFGGIYRNWDRPLYYRLLERFALEKKKQFRALSRGMKMKCAIAAALSHHPRLLLLDEATSGLDPMAREEVLDLFSEFTRDEGCSVLLSSHIVSDLEKLCDQIALLHRGRLLLHREKDLLLEEYGVVSCTRDQAADLPEEAVIFLEENPYGARALVRRKLLSPVFSVQRATLEEILLAVTKGGQR